MDKTNSYDIRTERIGMRQLTDSDLDVYHQIMKKEEVCKWLLSPVRKTKEETKQLIEKLANHWKDKGYGVFGVFDMQTDTLLGHCGVQYLKDYEEVEILYAFDPDSWRNGYATEAARTILEWAYSHTKLNRIIALAISNNLRSINVIHKLGFKPLGVKRYFGTELLCYEISRDSFLKQNYYRGF